MNNLYSAARAAPYLSAIVLVLVIGSLASCSGSPAGPPGSLVVSVTAMGVTPESGKLVEVVGTGLKKQTNENGLAEFNLAPGNYTVRVYGINKGGPILRNVEQDVRISSGATTRVNVSDCTLCD